MQDVLAADTRPFDARFPLICIDAGGTPWQARLQKPLPLQQGKGERADDAYGHEGMCSVFLAVEPIVDTRIIATRALRTKVDWASFMRARREGHARQAEQRLLVMDHLTLRSPASFDEVFAPEEAWRLSHTWDIHQIPCHGRWLKRVERERSVLARSAVSGRIPLLQALLERFAAWQERRTQKQATFSWRLPTPHARIKLTRLSPSSEA
jgi:hypothetical protein